MTKPAKCLWSHEHLCQVLKENAAGKLAPIFDAHPEISGTMIGVDDNTRQPFLEFTLPLSSIFRNVSDIPAMIGKLPVKLKYRPNFKF
jgi:hypothetical protein